jgi:PAS domain S-box-containing protein
MREEKKPVILVVDDSDSGRYATARTIKAAGYEILEAATGAEALRKARLGPEIIVLDINLPDIDGYEVCKRLKADPATQSIFVLHLTATYMSIRDKVNGLDGGADGFLTHPFAPPELIATINSLHRLAQAERKIERDAVQWQTTFDAMNDGICLLDSGGRILRSNRAFRELAGKSESELSGSLHSEILPNAGHEFGASPLGLSMKSLKREIMDVPYKDRWFQIAVDPVLDAKGELDGFIKVLSDTTERRLAAEEISLKEALLRKVLETLPVGVWILDADGMIQLCNQAGQRIWAGAEYVGIEQFGLYKAWRADSGKLIEAQEWGAARAVTKGETSLNEEIRIQCFDGSFKTILNSSAPIVDTAGRITGAVVVNQDISDRKHDEEAIKSLNNALERKVLERTMQLEAANAELESFSYAVSHDLRAPLRAMNGFATALAEQSGSMDGQGIHYLERIRESSLKMGQLINDLLGLSRVTRMDISRQRIDLGALAEKIMASHRIEEPGRKAEIEIAPDLVAEGDPRLLEIMLENLLGNAWKYTGKCELTRIRFGCEHKEGGRVFHVIDNGVGFDMAFAGKLFVPFQRLHGMAEFPGTGIGLVTVHRIITTHGGRIWPEAAPDKGATFYFTLGSQHI